MAHTPFIVLVVFLAVASATNHHSRLGVLGHKVHRPAASFVKTKTSTTTCFYNLFMTNYDFLGFGGATMSIKADDSYIPNFESVTLPTGLAETGFNVPVTEGQTLTISYEKATSVSTANSFYVTDINGKKVLSLVNPDSSEYSVGPISCSGCEYTSTCAAVRVRNEWRSLSYCDQQLYQRAIQTFRSKKDAAGAIIYDNYITQHNTISHTVASRELFLPWHRALIHHFEANLRAMGGNYSCISLPYWDWSLDFAKESASTVYADFGGLTAQSCLTGAYSWWYNPSLHECVYRRRFNEKPFNPAFPSGSAIELAITANDSYYYIFTTLVRNPHKSVHIFVGGSNGTMGKLSSPADPLFWLHHSNVDRIYGMWQDCWDWDTPATDSLQYMDISGTQTLDMAMPEFYPGVSRTVREMLDMPALSYRYPPARKTLYRLNGDAHVTVPSECQWDWFNPTLDAGVVPGSGFSTTRLPVHNTEQRARIAARNVAYTETLAATGDYYRSMIGQLTKECALGKGNYEDSYPAPFIEAANGTPIIGPSEMFKNACQLMDDGTLTKLFSQ